MQKLNITANFQHFSVPYAPYSANCCVPLQRICDDVPAFTNASTRLILSAVRQFLNCVVFAGIACHAAVIAYTHNNVHSKGLHNADINQFPCVGQQLIYRMQQ